MKYILLSALLIANIITTNVYAMIDDPSEENPNTSSTFSHGTSTESTFKPLTIDQPFKCAVTQTTEAYDVFVKSLETNKLMQNTIKTHDRTEEQFSQHVSVMTDLLEAEHKARIADTIVSAAYASNGKEAESDSEDSIYEPTRSDSDFEQERDLMTSSRFIGERSTPYPSPELIMNRPTGSDNGHNTGSEQEDTVN